MNLWQWLKYVARSFFRVKPKEPLPPLPKGTRYFSEEDAFYRGEKAGLLIVEREPQNRTILGEKTFYHLPFPYTVFIIRFVKMKHNGKEFYIFKKLQVGFRNKSLTWADDVIAALPLSNYEGDLLLGVCLGTGPRPSTFDTPGDMAQAVIAHYWLSFFTKLDPNVMVKWKDKGYEKMYRESGPLRKVAVLSKNEELCYA